MDWHVVGGLIAGALQLYSIVPYVKDMLHGETRPNVVSWALWTLFQIIIIAAQFTSGASWSVVVPIAMTFNTCLVLVICLFGYGYTKYGYIDLVCLILALCALVAWRVTNDPVLAIVLSIVADFIAAIPTYIKTYKEPFSESMSAWVILIVANGLAIISSMPFTIANIAFPAYVVVFDILFVGLMLVRRKQNFR